MDDIFNVNSPALGGQQDAMVSTPTSPLDFTQAPAFLQAADNHSLANGNSSWYDPTTWNLGEKALHTGYFVAASLASGANSIYNTAGAGANWLGGNFEANDITTSLSELDNNLGAYYANNKESADLVGFIATSFIPGLGGVKVLNAGQKVLAASKGGYVGANIAKSIGLLATDGATYAAKAGEEIAQTQGVYSLINRNVQRSILAGVGQATLESAAFETAVTATMNQSPILKDQDTKDILHNILIGGALGGAFGGAITGAINSKITKNVIKEADIAAKPFTQITSYPGMSASDKITSAFSDIQDMNSVLNLGPSQVPNVGTLIANKTDKLYNIARTATRELSGGDDTIGNMIADINVGSSGDLVTQNMSGVLDAARISTSSKTEQGINAYAAQVRDFNAKVAKRGGSEIGLKELEDPNLALRYVKLLGEGTGDISDAAPQVLRIADTVEPAGLFKPSYEKAVQDVVDSYKFKSPADLYNPLEDAFASHTKWEARYIWAAKQEIKPNTLIHENDIPLIEQATLQKVPFRLQSERGYEDLILPEEAMNRLEQVKNDVAMQLQDKYRGLQSNEEIAKKVNIKLGYLEGTAVSDNIPSDILATQSAQAQYNAMRIAKGLQDATAPAVDISTLPTYAKIGYSTAGTKDIDGNILSGMVAIRARYNAYQEGINNAVTKVAGNLYDRMVHPSDKMLLGVTRNGAGPGDWSFAGGAYNSVESWAQQTGAVTHDLRSNLVTSAREILNPVAQKLASNKNAAIEFQAINDKILSTSEDYILNDAGTGLISKKIKEYRNALEAGGYPLVPKLQEGAPHEIIFKDTDTANAVAAHIQVGGATQNNIKTIQAAQGIVNEKDVRTFYPIRPNEKDYPFKAFVRDDTVTGVGHMSMLHAADEDTLKAMIEKVNATTSFKTITRDQSEEYHKALGDWDYDKSLHDNYINSALKRNGVSSPFFQQTDPEKITEDWLAHHTKAQSVLASETMNAKFGKEFEYIRNLADAHGNVGTSRAGNANVIAAESDSNNPYLSYLRTSLDISAFNSTHPLLSGMQQKLDSIVSRGWDSIAGAVRGAQSVEDLDNVNSALQSAGVTSGYRDAATELLANHSAPRGVLNTFVRRANSIMAGMLIRTDGMNALNTAIGHNVLLGAETNHIISAIKNGRNDLVGPLADLMQVSVPGTTDLINSPAKLIAKSIKNWFDPAAMNDAGENLKDFYNRIGQSSNIRDALNATLGNLTLNGTEDATALSGKINNAFKGFKDLMGGRPGDSVGSRIINTGEKLTGNSYVHAFNEFVAADVIRQITDLGIKGGVIDAGEQLGYISTFTNRVHANILASQRPLMFQGPVGNAVGLFQSYQFNMMQQAFRYVGEGAAKDAGMLLGLQGTLHGVNGLPGFNFMNQHIVGEAAGNTNHKDITGAVYQSAGKTAGDWILYGAPSNIMGNNLYIRGDLNPHNTSVIPTSLADIPFVSAAAKFFGNLKNATVKIGDGGNLWQTFLQGVEHNGISRPLAGLAQTLQAAGNGGTAFSTTNKGDIIGANDIFSLATAARLMGGKPLDEAIAHDEVMRLQAYAASDSQKRNQLGEAIKSTIIAGGNPSPEDVNNFAKQYASLGGRQKEFSREIMRLSLQANTSQANVIATNLKNPQSQAMQRVMGGDPIMDGRNISNATSNFFNQNP